MADFQLNILKQIAAGLAAQFGSNCEVIIQDIAHNSSECSIVHIENGHVSGKKIGDESSGIVLNNIRHMNNLPTDHLAYLTKTDTGRILKSSTIYIKDDTEKPRYIFSINFDITNLLALEKGIHSLTECNTDSRRKNYALKNTHNVNELLDELIEQSVALVGIPVPLMTKNDKIKAIHFLNDAGAFLITKSGDKVAKYFGISKYTLYSYVDINK